MFPNGSSPRAWGTLKDGPRTRIPGRFIPTCVGNTRSTDACLGGSCGSSPRTWGTHPRVGTSSAHRSVHPHVRGEHCRVRAQHFTKLGSSPRAWGTLNNLGLVDPVYRFIPTCVGNTPYPTVRNPSVSGSSPRAWGTLPHRSRRPTTSTVHPHVRGEHNPVPLNSKRNYRFIPTCVGNTRRVLMSRSTVVGSSPRAWGTLDRRPPGSSRLPVHPHVRGEHAP